MNDLYVMDLEDIEGHRSERTSRKCWIMVFLLAIRSDMDLIGLQRKGDEVRFWLDGPPGPADLVPLPVEMVPGAFAFLWWIGQIPREGSPDRFRFSRARKRLVPPSVWESRFRIKLEAGLKSVVASASTEDGGPRVTLKIQDITISKNEASGALHRMMAQRRSSRDVASSE